VFSVHELRTVRKHFPTRGSSSVFVQHCFDTESECIYQILRVIWAPFLKRAAAMSGHSQLGGIAAEDWNAFILQFTHAINLEHLWDRRRRRIYAYILDWPSTSLDGHQHPKQP
jgi:hypothetical protein